MQPNTLQVNLNINIYLVAKCVVPNMTQNVIDRAIQAHGAKGVSQDTILARMFAGNRTLRIADGPDQVHMMQIAKFELATKSKI
jgi:acyl-CoA dehydrogenase